MHGTGGTIFGGISFGEFEVSAKNPFGSGTSLNGSALYLTFKCIGFNNLSCHYHHTRY